MLSNVGTSFFNGALTATGGITGTAGTTTLGVTLTSGFSNTGTLCNSGLISTNQLNAGSISNNNLTFYEQYTASAGTFRFSTLTTLIALPNTSLLYFNNFVVAGAYVWPGQTIQALNWTTQSSCNGFQLKPAGYPGSKFANICNITTCNWFLASPITGGSPPYFFTDLNNMSSATTGINLYVTNTGAICNGSGGFCNAPVAGGSQFNGSCNFNFILSDSSSPAFIRYLTLII